MKQRHIVGDCSADYGGDVRPILVPIECIQGDKIAVHTVKFKPCLTKQ